MDATASSQTGCSDLTSAPELSPSGAGAAAISPPAFANKPCPFSNSYRISPFAELNAHNCERPDGVLERKLACRLPAGRKSGFSRWTDLHLGFGCCLLHVALSLERSGSRIVLQLSPIMSKRHMNLCDRSSKSARRLLLDAEGADERSAADGLAEYLEERPQSSRRLVFPLRGEIVGFDLAANFLYSIVIRVDLMTFQTRDISSTSKKLADVSLGAASDAVCLLRSVSV